MIHQNICHLHAELGSFIKCVCVCRLANVNIQYQGRNRVQHSVALSSDKVGVTFAMSNRFLNLCSATADLFCSCSRPTGHEHLLKI